MTDSQYVVQKVEWFQFRAPDGKAFFVMVSSLPNGFFTAVPVDHVGGQHLLHHAQAEREAEIQPDRVADDLSGIAVAGVGVRRVDLRIRVSIEQTERDFRLRTPERDPAAAHPPPAAPSRRPGPPPAAGSGPRSS